MNRFKAIVALLALFAAGAVAAAAVAGKSPAALLQTTTTTTGTTTTATTTTGTTTTTTTTTTTGTTTTGTTTTPTTGKVTMCHHTRSRKNPHRTITVSANAVSAHTRHGDSVGRCTTAANVTRHSAATHVRRWHRGTTLRAELRAEAKAAKAKKGKKGKGKGK